MSQSDHNVVKTQTIHPTWIPFLQSLYWEGKLDILLAKGFVHLQLSDEEKKRWKLTVKDIDRVEKILQRNIEDAERNNTELRREILSILAKTDYIEIPNYAVEDDTDLFHELTSVSEEVKETIEEETREFVPLVRNAEYRDFEITYANWSRANHFPAMKVSASIISDALKAKDLSLPELSLEDWTDLPIDVCRFILLVNYYYDSKPNRKRISVFKKLLLKKHETLTSTIDFIIYSSWRTYSDEMFILTQEWVQSGDAYLVDWLIHGVEVPGRFQPAKALQFLNPVLLIDSKDIDWITKHVIAQIVGASPFDSLAILSEWLGHVEIGERARNIVEQALKEVIEDKIESNNMMDEDDPNLKNTLDAILQEWFENGEKLQRQVANNIISLLR
ncbi:MAG: hypothetical protein ACFFE2_16225 [Candidatus Thorarchaeota archaeon]